MKKSKIPDEFFRTSELGEILVFIAERLKSLSMLKAAFEKCVVVSVQTGKPVIDPFRLITALKSTQPDAAAALDSANTIYETLRKWAATEAVRATTAFEQKLRAFCENHSYKLDGRYPVYVVDGFLSVRVNEVKRETQIGTHTIASAFFDAIAPRIKELVTEERARSFDGTAFIERLHQAYERCVLLNRAISGDPMSVRKVYQELVILQQTDAFQKSAKGSLFREYTIELFARDLGKLLGSTSRRTGSGQWLSDRPTSFSQDGIPILQDGQARVVGKIVFSMETS
jgi:hypothetical protein